MTLTGDRGVCSAPCAPDQAGEQLDPALVGNLPKVHRRELWGAYVQSAYYLESPEQRAPEALEGR